MAPHFQSYTTNGEDVILWRALQGVTPGRYVDVGSEASLHRLGEHGLLRQGLDGYNR